MRCCLPVQPCRRHRVSSQRGPRYWSLRKRRGPHCLQPVLHPRDDRLARDLRVRGGSVTTRRPAFLTPRAGPRGGLILPAVMVQSFLKASLTFSPACLRLLLVWSIWPSRSICSLSVALPSFSLAAPFVSSFLFFSLSVQPITGLPSGLVVRSLAR